MARGHVLAAPDVTAVSVAATTSTRPCLTKSFTILDSGRCNYTTTVSPSSSHWTATRAALPHRASATVLIEQQLRYATLTALMDTWPAPSLLTIALADHIKPPPVSHQSPRPLLFPFIIVLA
jgi:hypothetical protein